MNSVHFVKGALLGFSLAAPIGPVGILCVRRTLEHSFRHGLAIGVSAAFCDMLCGMVAAFGITLVSDFISLRQHWIRLFGGIILLVLGYCAFRTRSHGDKRVKEPPSHTWTFFYTALLVFTNPLTFFAFAGAFALIGVENIIGHPASGLMLVAGVFSGSLAWFLVLAGLVHYFKERVLRVGASLVNRVVGALLMFCGLYALWNGISGL